MVRHETRYSVVIACSSNGPSTWGPRSILSREVEEITVTRRSHRPALTCHRLEFSIRPGQLIGSARSRFRCLSVSLRVCQTKPDAEQHLARRTVLGPPYHLLAAIRYALTRTSSFLKKSVRHVNCRPARVIDLAISLRRFDSVTREGSDQMRRQTVSFKS